MLEEFGLTHFMQFLDHIFAWSLNNSMISGTVIRVSQYSAILEGYLSDLYFFFPRDLLLFFASFMVSLMFIRILLSCINLAWW